MSQLKNWYNEFTSQNQSVLEMSAKSAPSNKDSSTKVVGVTNFSLFVYKSLKSNYNKVKIVIRSMQNIALLYYKHCQHMNQILEDYEKILR